MARRRSALYLDGAPEEYNPFAVPLGPYAERVTGRKTTAKQKGDKPRDLSVKVKPKASISRPNQGYVRRAEQAVSRAVPALEPFVQDVEGLLGPAEFEDALSRALPTLFGQDVYRGNADLAGEDASLFAINALAGPAFGLAGKGIKKVAGMVPASVREGASDLAARAGRYLRDVPGGALADADYVEGVFNVLPEEMGALEAPQSLKITTPDEAQWELPDLTEEVPIYTAPVQRSSLSVPARAAPAPDKVTAYHGTQHRFRPEFKVRDRETGEEYFIESPTEDRIRTLPANVDPLQEYRLGRFRMDKIGTGEGAQAYGRGLYFAEEPNVARGYRDSTLPPAATNPSIGGEDVYAVYNRLMNTADTLPVGEAQRFYDRTALLDDLMDARDVLAIRQNLERDPSMYSPEAVDWFNREVAGQWRAPGSLYQVDLNVDPSRMLAWDQPLSEQPEVLRALMPLLQKYQLNDMPADEKYPTLGGDIYHQLRFRSDVRDAAMSDLLTGSGIPGIRYLDQGSRAGGSDTENYVVMNPDLIEIMKRYKHGGLADKRKAR